MWTGLWMRNHLTWRYLKLWANFLDKIVTRIPSVYDLKVRRGCFSAVIAMRKMFISVLFLEVVLIWEKAEIFYFITLLCCLYKSCLFIIYLFFVILTFSLTAVIPSAIFSIRDKVQEYLIWAALELKHEHSWKLKTHIFYFLQLLHINIQLLCVSVTLKMKQKDANPISLLLECMKNLNIPLYFCLWVK